MSEYEIKDLLSIEAAFDNKTMKFVGLRLTTPDNEATTDLTTTKMLLFADKSLSGFRLGDHFNAAWDSSIDYVPVKIDE